MKDNDSVGEHRGAVREGTALLAGIVRCAGCGRRLYSYYPRDGHPRYDCSRHLTMAGVAACRNSIRCETLDGLVTEKLLDVFAPAGVELNLRVIEDEQCRREQRDTLHLQRVEQARYAADVAERRYRHVDPANRLVAAQLERQWETALNEVDVATGKLEQLPLASRVRLSDSERATFHVACAEVSALWQSGATIKERKQIVRLLLQRVEVDVQNYSERVRVRLHWCGGYESVHEITRVVQQFQQLECYETLIDRALELTLSGKRVGEVASILAEEGYRLPRHDKAISANVNQKLLFEHPRCHQQLNDPVLAPDQSRSVELAQRLGIAEKQLKDWGTRGWVTTVQSPFARTWVIFANKSEIERLQALVRKQTGRGRPKPPADLRTPASNSRKT